MNAHFTFLDGAVLAVYFLAVLWVGFSFRRKSASVDGYTAAGRNLPGLVTGLSILGTYVSSISFLALPGAAYGGNWNAFVFSLSLPFATFFAVYWFLPFYRGSGYISAYQHLEARFGTWARIYASVCYLLTQMARMGAVMYLMALPISILLGWDIRVIILITGVSVTAYTFFGGLAAVIWTDAVQTVILVIGALVCAAIMVLSLPGGVPQLFEIAAAENKFSLGSFSPSLIESTFWVTLVYGLVINLQNFGIDQNYVQRYLASRSDSEARKSVWFGGLMYLPVSAVFFFIGTALYAYYTALPEGLPDRFREEGQADSVFPWFIVSVLPPGVTGLLIAAVFAAAMSTVSTSLNSSATIMFNDFYKRFFRPEASEASSMFAVRTITLVWGAVGTGIALAMIEVASALDAWWTLAGIFGGGMLGLFLLGFLSPRTSGRAALIGVAAGVSVILWMTLSPGWEALPDMLRSPFHRFLVIVFGTATILFTGFLAAWFFNRNGTPQEN